MIQELKRLQKQSESFCLLENLTTRCGRFFETELCEACFEPEHLGIKIFWWWILWRLRNQDAFSSRFSLIELMSCEFSALRQ